MDITLVDCTRTETYMKHVDKPKMIKTVTEKLIRFFKMKKKRLMTRR